MMLVMLGSTYIQRPCRNRIRVRLFVKKQLRILGISDSDAGLKEENLKVQLEGMVSVDNGHGVEVLLVREI